ncbi:g1006 [Coccomyxa viridis]|uniref:G1006 protein n=1 Tax=Coccomyxa viridis TaxID=1274662 RepID=A0ABP1FH10_9CHLO
MGVSASRYLHWASESPEEVKSAAQSQPSTLPQEDKIVVFIMPAKEGRGPVHFPVQGERHDAAYVYDRLRSAFGAGDLQDPDVIEVMYDPSYELGPGNYLYILVGQGRIPNLHKFVGKDGQGLKAREYHTERETSVVTVLEASMRVGAVMVTGPPRSGKTSLLQLLNEAAVYSKLFSPIYYVDLEEHKGDLEQGLAQHDTSWGELFAAKRTGADETKLSLLLLDGAQLLFGGNPDFWSGIKALNMGPRPGQKIKTRTLRVIFTCSYVCSPSAFAGPPWLVDFGPDCIVSLDSQITVERLQLSIPDYHELLSNFRKQNCRGKDALCDNETCNYVYSKTAGQAGLITELLDVIAKHLEDKPFEPHAFNRTIRECMEQGGLPSSLILAPFQELVHDAAAASPKTVTLLDWLLEEACPAEGVPQLGDVEAWTTAEALYRLGFLAEREVNGIPHIGFISPLHRHICQQQRRKDQALHSQSSKQQPSKAQPEQERISKQQHSAPESLTKRLHRRLWA